MTKTKKTKSFDLELALVLIIILIFVGGVCVYLPHGGGGGGNGNQTTTTTLTTTTLSPLDCESHGSVAYENAEDCYDYICPETNECCVWHYDTATLGKCVCVEDYPVSTTTFPCIDGDGGPDPMVPSQCTDGGLTLPDICYSPDLVYEAVCMPNCQYTAMSCPDGYWCQGGLCVPIM